MDKLDLSVINGFIAESIKQVGLDYTRKYKDKNGVIDESLVNEKGEDLFPTTYIICFMGDELFRDLIDNMYNVYEDSAIDIMLAEYFETMKDLSPVKSKPGANLVVQAIAETEKFHKIKTSLEDTFIAVQAPGVVARNAVIESFY